MEIKVIGSGCTACKKLLGMTQDAVKQLNADAVRVLPREGS